MVKEDSVHDEVGLWIAHREAVIVAITDNGEEIERIESNVEGQLRRAGVSPLRGSHDSRRVRERRALRRTAST